MQPQSARISRRVMRPVKSAMQRIIHAAGYELNKRDREPQQPQPSELDRLVAPRHSFAEFTAEMARYERENPILPAPADVQNIVNGLIEDGVYFVPDFLPPATVKAMHDEAKQIAETVRSGGFDEKNRHVLYKQYGFLRLNNPENVAPTTRKFFNDPRIHLVVQSYLSNRGRRMDKYIDYKFECLLDANILPHADNIYRTVKVSLYMNDIPETNAPFTVWKKSHQKRAWRMLPDYLHYREHPYRRFGSVPSNVYNELGSGEDADIVKTECVARAGTAIFCDVSALHAASLLRGGYRLMLVDNWMAQENGKWLNPYHSKATPLAGFA